MRAMRAGFAVTILGGCLALVPFGQAVGATAEEILKWCRPDSPDRSDELCKVYVGTSAKAVATERMEDELGVACIPEDVTIDRLIALVLERVQPSPELANKTGFETIAPIFIQTFPCKR